MEGDVGSLSVLLSFGLGLGILTLALRVLGLVCCHVSLASTCFVLGGLELTILSLLRGSNLGFLGARLLDLPFC